MTVYQKIKKLCDFKGLSPTKLATELGFSKSTPSGWRSGSIPQQDKLKLIADYFAVDIEYFSDDFVGEPIDYSAVKTDEFNQPVWKHLLKENQYNERKAIRAYFDFEKAQKLDALNDSDSKAVTYNAERVVVQGENHAPFTINDGKGDILSRQEAKLLKMFRELDVLQQAEALLMIAKMNKNK